MIEVELRGSLVGEKAQQFKEFLDREAESKKSYHETAVFFNTDHIETLGSFAEGVARIQANQQIHDDGTVLQKIKMKVDAATGHGREEHEIDFSGGGLKSFFSMLERLDVPGASFRDCQRHDYSFGEIDVALKFGHVVGDHFEVETVCADRDGIDEAKRTLLEFLAPYDLGVWEPDEYLDIIVASREKAPYMLFAEGLEKFTIH